jgi:hypothetical protein
MSTFAASAVTAFRTSVIEAEGSERKSSTFHAPARWLLNRLHRFFDGLPKTHPDVNLEVLKRVPTPI